MTKKEGEGSEPTLIKSVSDLFEAIPEIEPTESSPRTRERKERARETIAFILVFGFLALLISSFLFAGTVDEAIKLIQSISASLSGMIGAILGYYYGTSTIETPTSIQTAQG